MNKHLTSAYAARNLRLHPQYETARERDHRLYREHEAARREQEMNRVPLKERIRGARVLHAVAA